MTTTKTPNDHNKDTQEAYQPQWKQQTKDKHRTTKHNEDTPDNKDLVDNKDNANDDYAPDSTTRTLERRQPSFFRQPDPPTSHQQHKSKLEPIQMTLRQQTIATMETPRSKNQTTASPRRQVSGGKGRPAPATDHSPRGKDPKRLCNSHEITPGNKDRQGPDPEQDPKPGTKTLQDPEPMQTINVEGTGTKNAHNDTTTKEMDTDKDDDGFTQVERKRDKKKNKSNGRYKDFTKKGPCSLNRPTMQYWNLKLSIDPAQHKDAKKGLHDLLNKLYGEAKARDDSFVLYKYEPKEGKPGAIPRSGTFPKMFKALQGKGPSRQFLDAYVYGLKTYNSKGKIMTVHTEIRVGYTENDLLDLLQQWVRDLKPAPYLRPKDLQAPFTKLIGFLFCCNPLMRDTTAGPVLRGIMFNLATLAQEDMPHFAVSSRWISDGVFEKKDPDKKTPLLQQKRTLHVEALASDASRTKALFKKALLQPAWKRYTNTKATLLPTLKDSSDKSRAKICVEKHRSAMMDLAWASTDALINPDHYNQLILREDDGKPASLRDLIMSVTIQVEVESVKDGKRIVTTKEDGLFLSMDELFNSEGTYAFVFPKAYEEKARNFVTGIYTHIFHMIESRTLANAEDVAQDIAVWFTRQAIEDASNMAYENGKVITLEDREAIEACEILDNLPWVTKTDTTIHTASEATLKVTQPRRWDNGDTASIHTQHTTHTTRISDKLADAIARAQNCQVGNSWESDEESAKASAADSTTSYQVVDTTNPIDTTTFAKSVTIQDPREDRNE